MPQLLSSAECGEVMAIYGDAKRFRKKIIMQRPGNLMEWYDFAIYGYMVPVISVLFFPSEDPVASIIATFSAFAAGYFTRPVGGIIFGQHR